MMLPLAAIAAAAVVGSTPAQRLPTRLVGARAAVRALAAPIDGLRGLSAQQRLGELRFAELSAAEPTAERVLSGVSSAARREGGSSVVVSLYYGQLTSGDSAGTRVLIKEFVANGSEAQPLRRALEGDDAAARLEALLASGAPACTAELVAENEFAAHVRLEARAEPRRLAQLSRCLGRAKVAAFTTQPASILLAFAWTGEQVRMAMPQRPPPTLASWMALRAAGATAGAFSDRSVPVIAARDRVRFIRQVLFDALKGLAVLHEVGLVHCAIGREVVGISTEDDRQPVKGRLEQLAFARDSETLVLACRAQDQVDNLDRPDLLDIGLRERAEKCIKAEADGDSSVINGSSLSDFAFADDMRAFGTLMLESLIVPCAPPGAITTSALAALCDGAYRGNGMIDRDGPMGNDISTSAIVTMDGRVDIAALRAYLMEDDGLRIGGVGCAELAAVERLPSQMRLHV